MANSINKSVLIFAGLLVLSLSGCGDGSTSASKAETTPLAPLSQASTPAPSPDPQPAANPTELSEIVVSGIVATGAPCSGAALTFAGFAIVSVPVVLTARDGSYSASITVTTNEVAKPIYVKAECPNAAGGNDTLASVTPTSASGTVNVNPLTNLISALVSKSGDPKLLGVELLNGTLTVDAALIAGKVEQLREILLPALGPLTLASAFDPIKGAATANGTGIDRLLDMLDIEITPNADSTSTVAIRLKIKNTSETDSQPVIRFTNVMPLDIIKFNNQITEFSVQQVTFIAGMMIPSQTAGLIADLIGRMNACYALAPGARSVSDAALSQTCASAFVDGKVTNFQENGLRGMDALLVPRLGLVFSDSAVTTLLTDAAATRFSLASYEYLRPNGVMGLSVSKTSPDTSIQAISLETQVGVDGKLGLSGNQYKYQAKIVPLAERRTFLNQKDSNYLSTGISISVPLPNLETTPLTKVVVTPPANRIASNLAAFPLFPGADGMALPLKDRLLNDTAYPSAGGFLRLRAEYTDVIAGATRRPPSSRELGEYFANEISESALQQFSAGDVWTVDFYTGSATTPESSQYYRLPARPYTISELRSLAVPDLTAETKTLLQSLIDSDRGDAPGITPLTGLPAITLPSTGDPVPIEQRVVGHTAPAGATSDIFFTDFNYLSSGRAGSQIVPCSNGANGDLHCAADGKYASGAVLKGVELLSRLPDRRELAHHFSVEQLLD